jgi:hypothetical protein
VFLRRRRQQIDSRSVAGAIVFQPDDWRAALAEVVGCLPSQPMPRTLQVGPHRVDVSVQVFRSRRGLAMLADSLGRSPAARAFRDGHTALMRGRAGVPPALPLACLERRVVGVLRESVLICERV